MVYYGSVILSFLSGLDCCVYAVTGDGTCRRPVSSLLSSDPSFNLLCRFYTYLYLYLYRLLYEQGFTAEIQLQCKPVVFKNVIESIHTLIQGARSLQLGFEAKTSQSRADRVMQLERYAPTPHLSERDVQDITHLWTQEPAIRATFQRRSVIAPTTLFITPMHVFY